MHLFSPHPFNQASVLFLNAVTASGIRKVRNRTWNEAALCVFVNVQQMCSKYCELCVNTTPYKYKGMEEEM